MTLQPDFCSAKRRFRSTSFRNPTGPKHLHLRHMAQDVQYQLARVGVGQLQQVAALFIRPVTVAERRMALPPARA